MKGKDFVFTPKNLEEGQCDTRPCGGCLRKEKCRAQDCQEWMGWFHVQWQGIQKAGGVR